MLYSLECNKGFEEWREGGREKIYISNALTIMHSHSVRVHVLTLQCLWLGDSVALSGSWDCTLRVWDLQVGICKHTLLGHTEGLANVMHVITRELDIRVYNIL